MGVYIIFSLVVGEGVEVSYTESMGREITLNHEFTVVTENLNDLPYQCRLEVGKGGDTS